MFRRSNDQSISFDSSPATKASPPQDFDPNAVNTVQLSAFVAPGGLLGRWFGRCLRLRIERFHCVLSKKKANAAPSSSSSSSSGDQPLIGRTPAQLSIKRVEVDANSLMPDYEVYPPVRPSGNSGGNTSFFWRRWLQKNTDGNEKTHTHDPHSMAPEYPPRVALTYSEAHKVRKRTFSTGVLDVDRFPQILFEVTDEDAATINGDLYLHGMVQPIKCYKYYHAAYGSNAASSTVRPQQGFNEVPDDGLLRVRCPIPLEEFHVTRPALWLGLFTIQPVVEVEAQIPLHHNLAS